MKCLTIPEARVWVTARVHQNCIFQPSSALPDFPRLGYLQTGYNNPVDSGRKVQLARFLLRLFADEPEILVYVHNASVFPSGGHLPLTMRFRQSLGETRPLADTPGHLLTANEYEDTMSLLVMAIEFFWDAMIIGTSGKFALYLSHDDYYDFFAVEQTRINDFQAMIERYM